MLNPGCLYHYVLPRPNLRLLISTTKQAGETLGPAICDVVFVDACHEAPRVREDLAIARGLVRPTGTILVHDYSDAWPAIRVAMDDFCTAAGYLTVGRCESLVTLRRRCHENSS